MCKFQLAVILSILGLCTSDCSRQTCDEDSNEYIQYREDVVVADAIFTGAYVGIARMIQRVNADENGNPITVIAMIVKHKENDSISTDHLWNVEHNLSPDNCSGENRPYAPFGITESDNYTTYCSPSTPEYCMLGDIASKSNLTSVGNDAAQWFTVPDLPLVGPLSVIGRSISIRGAERSNDRFACGNIRLNIRMTDAREVKIPVKLTEDTPVDGLSSIRSRIARTHRIPLPRLQTAFRATSFSKGCTEIPFLVFGKHDVGHKPASDSKDCENPPPSPHRDDEKLKHPPNSKHQDGMEKGPMEPKQPKKDEYQYTAVADAIFEGVLQGIVRMEQRMSPHWARQSLTQVTVRLQHSVNDSETSNHFVRVETNPASGVCDSNNTIYSPFSNENKSSQANYSLYCTDATPDHCVLGDITSKSQAVTVGKDVANMFSVPLLPLLGPSAVVGRSVAVYCAGGSSAKAACADLVLNKRATRAKIVKVPVKIPSEFTHKMLQDLKLDISRYMAVPPAAIHTTSAFDTLTEGCALIEFLLFEKENYRPEAVQRLAGGGFDLKTLTPKGCSSIISKPYTGRANLLKSNFLFTYLISFLLLGVICLW